MRPYKKPRRASALKRAAAYIAENAKAVNARSAARYRMHGADLSGKSSKTVRLPLSGQETGRGGGRHRANR